MKRWIALALSLALGLSLSLSGLAAEEGLANFTRSAEAAEPFADVAEDAWYAAPVADARALGLVQGVGEGNFNPLGDVSLAETLALACRLHDIYHGGDGRFAQTEPWYQVYVDAARARGILAGTGEEDWTALAPRSRFAVLLRAAFPEEALDAVNTVERLPDVPEDAPYAPAVLRLYRAGVLTGSDEYGTFRPGDPITRAEVAAILSRMADPALRTAFRLKTDVGAELLRSIAQRSDSRYGDAPALRFTVDGDEYLLYGGEADGVSQLCFMIHPAVEEGMELEVELRVPLRSDRTLATVRLRFDGETMVETLNAWNGEFSPTEGRLQIDGFWSENDLNVSNDSGMRRAMRDWGEYCAHTALGLLDKTLRDRSLGTLQDLGYPA